MSKELLGTFQMNGNLPIHSWYPYIAGYSAEFVKLQLNKKRLKEGDMILDPFCGVGTTLVVSKLNNLNSIGIDINPFATFVSETKLFWEFELKELEKQTNILFDAIKKTKTIREKCVPDLIRRVFSPRILNDILKVKINIDNIEDTNFANLSKLALLKIFRDVSNCSNFAPYIQFKSQPLKTAPVKKLFIKTLSSMVNDLNLCPIVDADSKIITGDSRKLDIEDSIVDYIVTSPPYLNNWDYSHITRIELFFMGYYKTSREITERLKSRLIKSSGFVLQNIENGIEPDVGNNLTNRKLKLMKTKLKKHRIKYDKYLKYDVMMTAYFNDMHNCLSELYRVLKNGGGISMVIGDSSLYGLHVKTDEIVAEIGRNVGFKTKIELLRERRATGHNTKLREVNILFKK